MSKNKKINPPTKYDYSKLLKCFRLYEYMYESAQKELDKNTRLVSDRTERIVIEYPDKFIEKYFQCEDSQEDIRKMLYYVLRRNFLSSLLLWTDDNRSQHGAGKDTIHIQKLSYLGTSLDMDYLLEIIKKYE